jgi:hypothetical protein
MPTRDKLKSLAEAKGISVQQLCKQAVAEHGTVFKAAIALGVYEHTIRYHLKQAKADANAAQA